MCGYYSRAATIRCAATIQINTVLVVSGAGPCLMGRDWLRTVRLDWRTIARVSSPTVPAVLKDQIAALQSKYPEVFCDSLGTITPFRARLTVKPDAQLKFFKPRPVPFALKELELTRLEQDGVIQKTHFSELAAPVVVVPKPDGRLRLCGDYKVTVNSMLDVDQYPLP